MNKYQQEKKEIQEPTISHERAFLSHRTHNNRNTHKNMINIENKTDTHTCI